MGHLHHAAADVNRRTDKSIDLQRVETDRSANNVDNRIKRAHFMKVNMIHGLIVYTCFCFSKTREDLHGALLHRVVQSRRFDDLFDIGKVAMFVLVRGLDARVGRTQSRSINRFEVEVKTFDRQQRELFAQVARLDTRGNHRAENHVAARSGETIEIQSLHC